MKRLSRILLFGVFLAGAGVFVWRETMPTQTAEQGARPGGGGGGRRTGGRRGNDGPASVLTAVARVEDMPVNLEAVGSAQALNAVTVRAQIDGRLMELVVREGQDVRKGDILARIDPTVYQASYDQAVAKKAQDEANLANARLDLQRYISLAATNAGSRQQSDTQRAVVAQLEAQVKSDQGAIDNARAYLEYATIRSPLAGRLGIRLVDVGNIIRASDASGLVVITQLRPITVLFNLPQQNLRAVTKAMAAGSVPVDALDSDNRTVLDKGRLEVVDNQVDPATGTVKVKATFPNADLQLWPGAFVNVRVTIDTLKNAVVVPTAAVQRGPSGPFVYVVDDDKVVLKPVTITLQTEVLTALASGIGPRDRVVTTGFARLNDGDRVVVADPPPPGEPKTEPPAAGDGSRRRRREGAQEGDVPTSSVGEDGRSGTERPRRRREGERQQNEAREPPSGPAPPVVAPPAVAPPSPAAPARTGSARP